MLWSYNISFYNDPFWIQMIDLAIAQSPKDINFEEFPRLNPHLLNVGLFLEYCKKETMLNNPTARQQMILIRHQAVTYFGYI